MAKPNPNSTIEFQQAKKISNDIQEEIDKANRILMCMEQSLIKLSEELHVCLEDLKNK